MACWLFSTNLCRPLSAKASTANASARHWHAASTSRWRIISKELEAQALKFAEQRLKASADAAVDESDRLRKEMERVEQQKNTLREQQLSADRRRRRCPTA